MAKLNTFLIVLKALVLCTNCFAGEGKISDGAISKIISMLDEGIQDGSISEKQNTDTRNWLQLSPCTGVSRTIAGNEKKELISALKHQFKQEQIEILDTFKYGGWYILFSTAGEGDEPYLFYPQNPTLAKEPIKSWSGAATFFETEEIYQGILKDTPQIPIKLAQCFSWHVTLSEHL